AEGLQAVYGESLYQQYGVGREDMALLFASGYFISLFVGTFLGISSDFIGRKKACLVFCILHFIGSIARLFGNYHSILMGTASVALASSLFSCTFETWMTAEHEKLGFRQDWLNDTFWTMSFGAATSSLGSAALANALVNWKGPHRMTLPSAAAALVTVSGYVKLEWSIVMQFRLGSIRNQVVQWYHWYVKSYDEPNQKKFVKQIQERFGLCAYDDFTGALIKLRKT
ncbi:hypothetical protein KI387_019553, partial [Taxus chinensis]